MGAVDTLIVWENLEVHRIVLKNHQTDGKVGKVILSNFRLCSGVGLEPVGELLAQKKDSSSCLSTEVGRG